MRVKRAFDVVVAAAAIVASSPVWAVAALAVKLTSRGPVLHRAQRVGREGKTFTLYKFRTMRTGPTPDASFGITATGDPRITAVGRVLRRLKIDELPQLINVVRADMSLVGPRPEDPRYVDGYTERQRRVLDVRPGITSPASIAYRHEEKIIADHPGDRAAFYRDEVLPAKLELDLRYVEERTFVTDLRVLVSTVLAVVRRPERARRSSARRS